MCKLLIIDGDSDFDNMAMLMLLGVRDSVT